MALNMTKTPWHIHLRPCLWKFKTCHTNTTAGQSQIGPELWMSMWAPPCKLWNAPKYAQWVLKPQSMIYIIQYIASICLENTKCSKLWPPFSPRFPLAAPTWVHRARPLWRVPSAPPPACSPRSNFGRTSCPGSSIAPCTWGGCFKIHKWINWFVIIFPKLATN